jgi:hypothetical protein
VNLHSYTEKKMPWRKKVEEEKKQQLFTWHVETIDIIRLCIYNKKFFQ